MRQTFVTTGATRGDQVAVLTGVKPGETVVTAGQIKLHNGSPVMINNTVQPSRRGESDSQPKTDGRLRACDSPTSSSAGRFSRRCSAC